MAEIELPDSPPKVAVLSMVLATHNLQPHVLMLRRNEPQRWHHNMWCIPGGKPKHGETVAQTAVRELKEEVGLQGSLNAARPLSLTTFTRGEDYYLGVLVIVRHWRPINGIGPQIMEPHNTSALKWMPLLPGMKLSPQNANECTPLTTMLLEVPRHAIHPEDFNPFKIQEEHL